MSTRGKKLTTEDFIVRASVVHANKFDYSLVVYKNTHTKVKIICPVHGEFEQIPMDHLKGTGCGACSGKKKHTQEEFLNQIQQIHLDNGDTYDYSLVKYKNLDTKVKIVCPTHGEFSISPRSILQQNAGCSQCGRIRTVASHQKGQEEFIAQAIRVHNGKYSYENTTYIGTKTKISITCPIHGIFEQTPDCHLNQESGCPECKREKARENPGGYTFSYFANHPDQKEIPATLYSALITNGNERFLKIGITAKSTQFRFNRGEYKSMDIELLYEKALPLYEAFQIEQQFIEEMKLYKFFSNTKFSGYTECFRVKEDVLNRINEIFKIQ